MDSKAVPRLQRSFISFYRIPGLTAGPTHCRPLGPYCASTKTEARAAWPALVKQYVAELVRITRNSCYRDPAASQKVVNNTSVRHGFPPRSMCGCPTWRPDMASCVPEPHCGPPHTTHFLSNKRSAEPSLSVNP